MVAIVSGSGLGLFNASNNILGSAGVLGQGWLGQAGGRSYVNAATGNLVLQFQDEQLSGRGADLLHLRTYNSLGNLNDGDGDGWRWDGERRVSVSADGKTVVRTGGDGHATAYQLSGARYVSTEGSGAHDYIEFNSTTREYTWTDGSGRMEERYDTSGRLVRQKDVSGNVVEFLWSGGRLVGIKDLGSGQRIELKYQALSTGTRLTQVNTYALEAPNQPVRQVTYGYQSGRLTTVTTDLTPQDTTDSNTYVTSYTYDTNGRITAVAQSDGTSVQFTYYADGRIHTVEDAAGLQTFTYVNNTQTNVSFDTGDGAPKVWTYIYDGATKQLTQIKSPAPVSGAPQPVTTFHYDASGNVDEITQLSGTAVLSRVVYGYDAQGNLIRERDAEGNTISRTYNSSNQIVTETRYRVADPDGGGTAVASEPLTTRFVYDGQSRLRFVVSAEGRVVENRYGTATNGFGLLTATIRYAGTRYDVSALGETDVLQESTLASWVSQQMDKSQVERTQYTYDLRGNLERRTDFATVDANGNGVLDAAATVTDYVYSAHGELLQTIAKRGANRADATILTSFVYDGLGREISRVSAGVTHATVYDGASRTIEVTNQGTGLIETRTFDQRGRLTSVAHTGHTGRVLSNGAEETATRETKYVYDMAGQLRMSQDALGDRHFNFYDEAGRLQYTVDSTGAVCGYEYDAAGHMTARTCYATRIDAAEMSNWVTTTTEVVGGVTIETLTVNKAGLTVGASGADITTDAQHDRMTRSEYDSAGRLVSQIDAGNVETATSYDGASRVTQQQTGERTTRYFYDRDGRQVGMLDAEGYLTENRYDAAGRLVEAIRYTTRSPAAANVSAPVWVGITDQTAVGNQPFAYRMPVFDPDGDALIPDAASGYQPFTIVGPKPDWLTLDTSAAGGVTLRGTAPATLTTYEVTVRADDGRGKTSDVKVRITVANTAPSWGNLPDSTVPVNSSDFSLQLPAASDIETPADLTYSIDPLLLPPGLTFNAATRTISGIPTTPGTYIVTARVTDASSPALHTERRFVITITNDGPSWAAFTPPPAYVNTSFTFTVPAATDPEGEALTYEALVLPAGFSFDPVTRLLTATPSTLGPKAFALVARDPYGAEVQLAFSIVVENRVPTWTLASPPAALAGVPFDYLPSPATDPDGQTLTYTAVGLPPGLSINSANGRITGVSASVGSFPVTLHATDPHGASATVSIVVVMVNAAPVYNGGLSNVDYFSGLEADSGFLQTITIPGAAFTDANNQALTYSAVGMPEWMSFDPATRTFSGFVPDDQFSLKSFPITVTVTDPFGAAVSANFTVTVHPDTFSSPPPPPGWPPTSPKFQQPGGGLSSLSSEPISPIAPAPAPAMVETAAPAAISPAPAPLQTQLAALVPVEDVLAAWRPTNTEALHSYRYYDAQGRLVGSVDERGFLTESVYNEQANTQQSLRYETAVTVNEGDTLATLRVPNRAGIAQTTTVEYDQFGRVSDTISVDGTVTHNEYDSAGRLVRVVSAVGTSEERASRTRYNDFGEVTGTLGGTGEATLLQNHPVPTQSDIDAAIATRGTRYEYDYLGRRIRAISANEVDGNGYETLYFYDSEGRLSHTVRVVEVGSNPKAEVSQVLYNAFGQQEAVRRYHGWLSGTTLQGLLNGTLGKAALETALEGLESALDETATYEYDKRGLLTQATDGEGFATSNTYNIFGQLAQQVRTILKGTATSAPRTTTAQFDYDLLGRLVSHTADVGGINFNTQTAYDAYGRVIRSIDAAGKVTQTDYQDSGRTIVITDPLGHQRSTEYDAFARVLKVTDALGAATTYAYDDVERSLSVTTPEGLTVTTFRTRHGETLQVVDGRGNTTQYEYNDDGQLSKVTDALGNVVANNEYYKNGRLHQTTDARGVMTTFSYDAVGRLVRRSVDPAGLNLTTTYHFDALGRQILVREGQGSNALRVTSHQYDRNGRLVRTVVDPNGLRLATTYSYDGLGDTIRVARGSLSEPDQQVTLYEFDNLGRRVREIAAPSTVFGAGSARERDLTTEYRYDQTGRVSRTIDANGNSTWFVYDEAGQLRQTINAAGEVSENFHDANGRVIQTRRYRDRISTAVFGDVVTAATPQASSADQRTYFVYDQDGRQRFVLSAVVNGYWTASETRFDANGNVIETRAYDKFIPDSLVGAVDIASSPGVSMAEITSGLRTLNYKDTALGSETTDESTLAGIRRTRFAYDANNRLRFTVDALGSVSEKVYDAAGNVLRDVRYASRPTLTAYSEAGIDGAVNRADAANHVMHFAYDAAGRVRFISQQLVAPSQGSSGQVLVTEQVYDALGRAVRTVAYSNATTDGVFDFSNLADMAIALLPSNQDRISAAVYDAAGRQIYSVQALTVNTSRTSMQHIVTRSVYDALGQMVQTTAYAATPVLTSYTQQALDTAVAASAVANDPANRTTRFTYDRAGRLRFAVAADGSFSENVYDGLGQVMEARRFDVLVSPSTSITEEALVARRAGRHVGDGVTRGEKHTYDAAGRRLTTTDAAGHSDISTYDALGNRVAFVDKNGVDLLKQHQNDVPPFDAALVTWTYEYDLQGRLVDERTPEVSVQLSNETAPVLRSLRKHYTYDELGNLINVGEAVGTVDQRNTVYGYDLLGRQTMVVLPGYYDPTTGRVESGLVANNPTGRFLRTLETSYDAFGNTTRTRLRTGPGASEYQYEYKTYDAVGRVVHDVDALGHVTRFIYTAFGEQSSVTRFSKSIGTSAPGGAEAMWTAGAVDTALGSDPLARVVTISYDNLGRKTEVSQSATSRFYAGNDGPASNPSSVADASATPVTTYEYTTFGEVRRESIRIDNEVDLEDPRVDGRWRSTWHYYDLTGREVRTIDAAGYHTARTFDANGNLVRTIEYANASGDVPFPRHSTFLDPGLNLPETSDKDRTTVFSYNALNQQTSIKRLGVTYSLRTALGYIQTTGDVVVASMTYDAMGHVRTKNQALGDMVTGSDPAVTTTEYDALGQIVKVTEPERQTAGAQLDPFLSKVTASPVTTLTRDAFGNVVRTQRSPGGGQGGIITTREQYDFAGNAIRSIDAKGNEKLRRFDFAGRVVEESQAINVTLTGWLTNAHTLTRRYAYDASGRQIAVVDMYMDGATAVQSGQRSLFNAFGEVVEEWRVWGGQAVSLGSLSHAKVATYTYDNAGNLIGKLDGTGETRYFYDLAGQVTRQEQRGDGSPGTIVRITETGYNIRGEATIQRMPSFSAAFRAAGGESTVLSYVMPFNEQTFDRWGNVTSRTLGGYNEGGAIDGSGSSTTTYIYNHDNQVIAEIAPVVQAWRADGTSYDAIVTHELHYDLQGRAVRERDFADDAATATNEATLLRSRSKEYNAAGQLTAETDGTSRRTEYVYDAHGNRVGTKNNHGTVFVDSFDANGNLTSHGILRATSAENSPQYVHGVGTPVLRVLNLYSYDQANRRVESADVMDAAGTIVHRSFTKLDERNLVRAQRNAAGVVTTLGYDQFGNKTHEQLGSAALGNIQTWNYSAADDYTVGRLLGATAGSSATSYEYNGFGQVKREVYGVNNQRSYTYHDNGLLKSIEDRFTKGTAGEVGGLDYLDTTELTQYDYTVKGELAKERFTREGSQDESVEVGRNPEQDVIFYAPREVPLDPIIRTTFTRYDALGRATRVWAPAGLNNVSLSSLDYSYDELGNIRRIQAPATNNWFTYDAEGRMTIADGELIGGLIAGGTTITYDDLGRRQQTEKFHKSGSYIEGVPGAIDEVQYGWNEYRQELYEYSDLGYLERIYQNIAFRDRYRLPAGGQPDSEPDTSTGWYLLEQRENDVRGALTTRRSYSTLETKDGTHADVVGGDLRFVTTSGYRADGLLTSQQTTETGNTQFNEALFGFDYDDGGMLHSYKYVNGVGSRAYVDTFTYTYGMEFGGLKERTIDVTRVANEDATPGVKPGNTTNTYDARGRVAKTVISNAQQTTSRSFFYDNQGHALLVDEKVSTSADVKYGTQAHFFANGRQVGTHGTGTLSGANFSFAYTPITQSVNNPSSYTVRSGDSLVSIAQQVYGDGALWYLIADANSISLAPTEALPSTELAKTYRIPSVARSHNNASTFKPYSVADVIGNTSPSPALPVPPEQCSGVGRVVATVVILAISMTVQALVTAYVPGPAGAALGAAAGDLAGQTVGWTLGLQDGIDWGQVGEAGAAGLFAGGAAKVLPGTSLGARIGRAGASAVGNQVAHQLLNRSDKEEISIGGTLFSMATSIGTAALGKRLEIDRTYFDFSHAAGQLANNALNPQTGWLFNERMRNWDTIASQAASAFTSVAVNAVVEQVQSQAAWSKHEAAVRKNNQMRSAIAGDRGGFLGSVRRIFPGATFAAAERGDYQSPVTGFSFGGGEFQEAVELALDAPVSLANGPALPPGSVFAPRLGPELQSLSDLFPSSPGGPIIDPGPQAPMDPTLLADLDALSDDEARASVANPELIEQLENDRKNYENDQNLARAAREPALIAGGVRYFSDLKQQLDESEVQLNVRRIKAATENLFSLGAGGELIPSAKQAQRIGESLRALKGHDAELEHAFAALDDRALSAVFDAAVVVDPRLGGQDVSPLTGLLDAAASTSDADLKARVFVAGTKQLDRVTGSLGGRESRLSPTVYYNGATGRLTEGLYKLLLSDSVGVVRSLSTNHEKGYELTRVVRNIIDSRLESKLGPVAHSLRAHFGDTIGTQSKVHYAGATAAGYFIGAVGAAIDQINSGEKEKLELLVNIFAQSMKIFVPGQPIVASATKVVGLAVEPTKVFVRQQLKEFAGKNFDVLAALNKLTLPSAPKPLEVPMGMTKREYEGSPAYEEWKNSVLAPHMNSVQAYNTAISANFFWAQHRSSH